MPKSHLENGQRAAISAPDPKGLQMAKEYKHDRPVTCCRFDPSGRFIVAGAQDEHLHRWDHTGKADHLPGPEGWVQSLAFRPDGQSLASGDSTGRVLLWPVQEAVPKPVRSIAAHEGCVRSLAASADGQLLATGGNDKLVRIWSLADGKKVLELAGHEFPVYSVAIHPEGKAMVSGDLKGVLRHWDLATGKLLRQLDAGVLWKYDTTFRAHAGGVKAMRFTPDGARLICAGISNVTNAFAGIGNPLVLVLDWETGKPIQKLAPADKFTGFAWGVAVHPDGMIMAVGGGGSGGALWFWKPADPKPIHTLAFKSQGYDVDLDPATGRVAVAHYDGFLRVYEPKTPAAGTEPKGPKAQPATG